MALLVKTKFIKKKNEKLFLVVLQSFLRAQPLFLIQLKTFTKEITLMLIN
jgi:hypothetical protein